MNSVVLLNFDKFIRTNRKTVLNKLAFYLKIYLVGFVNMLKIKFSEFD